MAGHSRWAQVKHRKAGTDAKRSVEFSRFVRLITVAAREGGTDPETNPRLRQAVDQARNAGLPKDNIERAIARVGGEDGSEAEVIREYEAYGPGGSAIIIHAATDNPNRTTSEVKAALADFGGKLADAGSVAWLFARRVEIEFTPSREDTAETLELALIEAGVEDIRREGERLFAIVKPDASASFEKIMKARGVQPAAARTVMIPKRAGPIRRADSPSLQKLLTELGNHPDVTAVWSDG